jgi:hypothetical protein
MSSSLSLEQIDALLTDNTKADGTAHEKPIQIGPLKYSITESRCVSRRCGAPTMISVNGASYCSTHALYELNRIVLGLTDMDWVLKECNCKTGEFSKGCMHNEDCGTFARLKGLTTPK